MPASLVYEDEKVVAFLDIKPLNEGHTLVIPKAHYENIFDVPRELIAYIHGVTSIIQQDGKAAGQDIFHLHVHVVPRFDGQKLPSFSELAEADREELSRTAAKIRKYL